MYTALESLDIAKKAVSSVFPLCQLMYMAKMGTCSVPVFPCIVDSVKGSGNTRYAGAFSNIMENFLLAQYDRAQPFRTMYTFSSIIFPSGVPEHMEYQTRQNLVKVSHVISRRMRDMDNNRINPCEKPRGFFLVSIISFL